MGSSEGSVVKNPPANASDLRDASLIPGLGKSPGEGNGNPLQYSCLENSTDREAWRATVHGATKSRTRLSDFHSLNARRPGFSPWVRKIPWRREWQPTPVFLPGEFHGQGSLADYNPWDRKESDMTEQLTHTHTHTHTFISNVVYKIN